jgi:hypothetical protein
MVDNNLTVVVAILYRSGSMQNLRSDTIGGFNSFITEQKKGTGKVNITLVQFDNEYQIDYEGKDINEVPELNEETYVPRGGTALLDACGRTINAIGMRLAATEEDKRPGQVIFLIITDGEENSSKEFTRTQVKEMITHQEEKYNWNFVFMGGGDVNFQKAQGASFGIKAANVYGYSADSVGVAAVYSNLSKGVTRQRHMLSIGEKSDDAFLDANEVAELITDKK